MKRVISFDSYEASAYDIVDGIYPFRAAPGVKSIEVLSAVEGSPKYAIVIDVDDEQDAELSRRFEEMRAPYASYLANYTSRAFRKVG